MLHNQRALRHLPMLFILLLLTPPRQPHEDGPAYHPGVCILSLGGPAIIRFTRKKAEEATPEEAPPPGQTAIGGGQGDAACPACLWYLQVSKLLPYAINSSQVLSRQQTTRAQATGMLHHMQVKARRHKSPLSSSCRGACLSLRTRPTHPTFTAST